MVKRYDRKRKAWVPDEVAKPTEMAHDERQRYLTQIENDRARIRDLEDRAGASAHVQVNLAVALETVQATLNAVLSNLRGTLTLATGKAKSDLRDAPPTMNGVVYDKDKP